MIYWKSFLNMTSFPIHKKKQLLYCTFLKDADFESLTSTCNFQDEIFSNFPRKGPIHETPFYLRHWCYGYVPFIAITITFDNCTWYVMRSACDDLWNVFYNEIFIFIHITSMCPIFLFIKQVRFELIFFQNSCWYSYLPMN